ICEAALYAVVQSVYSHDQAGADPAVKDCFRTIEERLHKISGYKATMNIQGNVTGELCLRITREEPLSEPKFAPLIRAGKAIGIYDGNFEQRLNRLRDDRNTIHLANQIERSDQLRGFNKADRTRAKKITEDLRLKLKDFVESLPWSV